MGALAIWNRLFWKSFKEGWKIALVALIAPPVLFTLANRTPVEIGWLKALFALPAAAGVHLAIALWAAGRGGGKRESSEFAWTHLPLKPITDWAASLLFPLVIVAGLGLWFGAGAVGFGNANTAGTALAGALDLVTTYALCYFISSVISSWAAVIFGAFRVIGGTLIPVWSLSPDFEPDALRFVIRTAAGAVVSSMLLAFLSRKMSLGVRQVSSMVVMLLIIFIPGIKDLDLEVFKQPEERIILSGGGFGFRDSPIRLEQLFKRDKPRVISFRYINKDKNMIAEHDFQPETQYLYMTEDEHALFLQQRSRKDRVRIIEWNIKSDKTRTAAVLDATGDVMPNAGDSRNARMDMNWEHKKMILHLKSMIGNGYDVWLIDLKTGENQVIFGGVPEHWPEAYSWGTDKVIAYGGKRIEVVDLNKLTVKTIKLRAGEERQP